MFRIASAALTIPAACLGGPQPLGVAGICFARCTCTNSLCIISETWSTWQMSQILRLSSRRCPALAAQKASAGQCSIQEAASLLRSARTPTALSAAGTVWSPQLIMMKSCALVVLALCLVAGVSAGDYRNGRTNPEREEATLFHNYVSISPASTADRSECRFLKLHRPLTQPLTACNEQHCIETSSERSDWTRSSRHANAACVFCCAGACGASAAPQD